LNRLEELLIGDDSFKGWDVVGTSKGGMNASLTELNSLSNLAVLSLKIPKVDCIPGDFVFPRLLKYEIILGNGHLAKGYPTSTRLYLGDTSATSLNAKTFAQLFPTVSEIVFSNVEDLKNIVFLTVSERDEFDEESNEEKELPLLPSLKTLQLSLLPELICIWKGPTRHVSLHSLTCLILRDLDKLSFIFPPSLSQSLPQLQTLEVENCRELKHIIREKDGDERKIIARSLGFPQLKTVYISRCGKLEYVFPVFVSPTLQSLPQLETLQIRDCRELEHIIKEEDGERKIIPESPCFPELKTIFIEKCGKLEYVFPVSVSLTLQNLERMTISYAYNLKQIFCGGEESSNLMAQSQVRPLYFSINFFFFVI